MSNVINVLQIAPNNTSPTGSYGGPIVGNMPTITSSFFGNPISLQHLNDLSFVGIFSGTLAGTVQLQVSNDPGTQSQDSPPYSNIVNWAQVQGSLQNVTAPQAVSFSFPNAAFRFVRGVFTWTSGSGQCLFEFNAKEK